MRAGATRFSIITMKFFDLVDISERGMELVNPTSAQKVVDVGRAAGMNAGARVIDFGSGFAEPLALWAAEFGVHGVGIEIRPKACERARTKLQQRGLDKQIEIVCMAGADYRFESQGYDVATCIGASFIWGGFQPALQQLRKAIRPAGAVIIGEPYWLSSATPAEFARREGFFTEWELLEMARTEGFDMTYVARASHDEWDRYERENWQGLIAWLRENSSHPEREDVLRHLRRSQDDYFRYGRECTGWAMYVLTPAL